MNKFPFFGPIINYYLFAKKKNEQSEKKAISLQYLKVVPVGPPSESNFEKKIVPAPRFIVLKMGLHHLSRRVQDTVLPDISAKICNQHGIFQEEKSCFLSFT